jgi:hypothetical protein
MKIVSIAFLNSLLDYLGKRPYVEVSRLVTGIMTLQDYVPEVKEETSTEENKTEVK